MTSNTTMSKVSRLEVIQTGARRRWTPGEKLRIVAESASVPRNVSATARRHGLSVGQLFVWRRLARDGKLDGDNDVPAFIPAIIAPAPNAARALKVPADRAAGMRIEIVLSEPRRLIVGSDVDLAAVAAVLALLERR